MKNGYNTNGFILFISINLSGTNRNHCLVLEDEADSASAICFVMVDDCFEYPANFKSTALINKLL